jgi:uncharacterized membrane protein YfcA
LDIGVVLALAILFAACLFHATFGFGTASVAMPLLVLVVGLPTATALVGLVTVTIIGILLARDWRGIELAAASQLLLATAVGIPLGLIGVKYAPEQIMRVVLGCVLMTFSLYSLSRPALPQVSGRGWAYGFGFVAGVLGGAYNTNAPPAVLYGAMRDWDARRFRATLQGYFLPAAVLIAVGHGLSGLWNATVLTLYLFALPVVVLAIPVGRWISRRIPVARFQRLVFAALAVLAGLLFL